MNKSSYPRDWLLSSERNWTAGNRGQWNLHFLPFGEFWNRHWVPKRFLQRGFFFPNVLLLITYIIWYQFWKQYCGLKVRWNNCPIKNLSPGLTGLAIILLSFLHLVPVTTSLYSKPVTVNPKCSLGVLECFRKYQCQCLASTPLRVGSNQPHGGAGHCYASYGPRVTLTHSQCLDLRE